MTKFGECLFFNASSKCNEDCGCPLSLEDYLSQYENIWDDPLDHSEFRRLVQMMRDFRASGDLDRAIFTAIHIGGLLEFKHLEDAWLSSVHVSITGRKAAEATWGPEKDRRARREALRSLYKLERKRSPNNEVAYRAVAKRTGKSPRTVRRAVESNR
jgi:hypothetical protein